MYHKYVKVEHKVGQKLQLSAKSTTYTLKSRFKSHIPSEHPNQPLSSKPTFFNEPSGLNFGQRFIVTFAIRSEGPV